MSGPDYPGGPDYYVSGLGGETGEGAFGDPAERGYTGRISPTIDDAVSSYSILVSRMRSFRLLVTYVREISEWMKGLSRGTARVADIPSVTIENALTLINSIRSDVTAWSAMPLKFVCRVRRLEDFILYARTMPRIMGRRPEDLTMNAPILYGKYYNAWRECACQTDDTLPTIAAREMGDAKLWPIIAQYNRLDPQEFNAADNCGTKIKIPVELPTDHKVVEKNFVVDYPEGEKVLGTTVRADRTTPVQVDASTEDFITVSGQDNYQQALLNRLDTEMGYLYMAPKYGTLLEDFVGAPNTKITDNLLVAEVRRVIFHDPRTQHIRKITVQKDGNARHFIAEVYSVLGGEPVVVDRVV